MVLNNVISFVKKMDPEIFIPLFPHIGKSIQFNIACPFSVSRCIFLQIENNNIRVTPSLFIGQKPDLILSGNVFDFARFGLDYQRVNALHYHHIQCIGDVALLQVWQDVLQNMDLDWSALWAGIVGDKWAFPLTQLFKKGKQHLELLSQSAKYTVHDYVLYEKNGFVSSIEVENWIEDIMTLRNDSERLEKNLALLTLRLEKLR